MILWVKELPEVEFLNLLCVLVEILNSQLSLYQVLIGSLTHLDSSTKVVLQETINVLFLDLIIGVDSFVDLLSLLHSVGRVCKVTIVVIRVDQGIYLLVISFEITVFVRVRHLSERGLLDPVISFT